MWHFKIKHFSLVRICCWESVKHDGPPNPMNTHSHALPTRPHSAHCYHRNQEHLLLSSCAWNWTNTAHPQCCWHSWWTIKCRQDSSVLITLLFSPVLHGVFDFIQQKHQSNSRSNNIEQEKNINPVSLKWDAASSFSNSSIGHFCITLRTNMLLIGHKGY